MKAKKLLMMMSAIAAMVAGSSAKAETEKEYFPFDQQQDIMGVNGVFNQTEVARIPVNGAYVSIVKGWQAGTKVVTKNVTVIEGKEEREETRVSTNRVDAADLSQADKVWTAPFIVHDGNMKSGFTKAMTDTEYGFLTNGISTVTVNPDNGKMYVFENNNKSHDHFWELNMNTNSITATEPLKILSQLNPGAKEVPFYSGNSDMSDKLSIRADRAFSFGKDGVGSGEWIVTYDSSAVEGDDNTVILHRNGVVNQRLAFQGIEPKEVTVADTKVYVSNGTSLYSMDKANPTNGYTQVELSAGNQGHGVTSTGIYQVNAEGEICNEAGTPMNLYKKIEEDTAGIGWGPYENKGAFTDMMVDDQGRLITAFSADAEVDVKDLYIGEAKHPMKAISGVQKIVSAQNGVITALTKSGATIQHTYDK